VLTTGTGPTAVTTTVRYAVPSAGATPAAIAAGFAAAINAQAQPDLSAVVEGNQVFIVNRAGAAFGATYSVAPAGSLVLAAAPEMAGAVAGGTVRTGDRFSIDLTIGTESVTVSYTAVAGDTAAKVVAALAALINNSTDPDAATFTATASGTSLFIVKTTAGSFTASPSHVPAAAGTTAESVATKSALTVTGSTVVAGETWILTLASGDTVTRYSFTAAGNVLQTILDELAKQVNVDAANAYTADSASGSLQIFRVGNVAFTAGLSVAPAGVPAIDAATARTAAIALTGNPVAGEKWRVAFGNLFLDYTVAGNIAGALAGLIN
jgi:hypothetical protein